MKPNFEDIFLGLPWAMPKARAWSSRTGTGYGPVWTSQAPSTNAPPSTLPGKTCSRLALDGLKQIAHDFERYININS